MSENEYLLPLTERETVLLADVLAVQEDAEVLVIWKRLLRLEPIGTGGTTEGA